MSNQAYIMKETLLGAGASMVLSGVGYLALFGGQDQVALWGLRGVLLDCLPHGFIVGYMSVFVPGLITKARIKRGALAVSTDTSLHLLRSVASRALPLGLFSMIGLTAIATFLAFLSGATHIPFALGLVLKATAGAVLAILITPAGLRPMLARTASGLRPPGCLRRS